MLFKLATEHFSSETLAAALVQRMRERKIAYVLASSGTRPRDSRVSRALLFRTKYSDVGIVPLPVASGPCSSAPPVPVVVTLYDTELGASSPFYPEFTEKQLQKIDEIKAIARKNRKNLPVSERKPHHLQKDNPLLMVLLIQFASWWENTKPTHPAVRWQVQACWFLAI